MREIKFRAWNRKHKQMWFDGGHMDLALCLEGGLFTPDSYWGCDHDKNFELMQYTGLKDKNGKEVYHQDIVKRGNILFVVEWHSNTACWFLKYISGGHHGITKSDMALMCEVIGNIYENKELLDEKTISS
jgi:hypothetical protein